MHLSLRHVRLGPFWAVMSRCCFALCLLSVSTAATAVFDPLQSRHLTGSPSRAVEIEVAGGDWGHARPAQIRELLESVAMTFLHYGSDADDRVIRIRVLPRSGGPRVLYERGGAGTYRVHLSARDTRWYQYAYQFGHELCHILSNFDHKDRDRHDRVATENQWFEESLCETAALFTLRRLSTAWQARPPSRNWLGYAPVFAEYADHLLSESHRELAPGQTFDQWFAAHRQRLRSSPYQRHYNEVVASRLLPMFEQAPYRWRSIAYLNRDTGSAAKGFYAYLADWQTACPPEERRLVEQTLALFGDGPGSR